MKTTTTAMAIMIATTTMMMMSWTGATMTASEGKKRTGWMEGRRDGGYSDDFAPLIRRHDRSAAAAEDVASASHLVHPHPPPIQSTHQLVRPIQNDFIPLGGGEGGGEGGGGREGGTDVRINASSSSTSSSSSAAFHHLRFYQPHQQQPLSVNFRSPGAYLVFRVKLYSTFSIQFQLRTVQSDGLILFSGNIGSGKDFLALELVNARLRYIFDLGAGARTVQAGHDLTAAPLNDDRWHRISIVRSTLSEHVIRVDDDVTADHLSDGRSLFFDTLEELYVGGVPEYAYNTLPKQIRSRDGFQGCLGDVQLDRKTISLLEHPIGIPKTHRKQIVNGCDSQPTDGQQDEGNGSQCTDKSCDNSGVCIQQTAGFVCNCDMTSYTGPTCKEDSVAYKFGRHGGVVTFTFPDGEWPDTKRDEISLGFRTFQSDAILLHISSASSANDFIEMELVDGNVVVIYNMGLMQHPIGELFEKVHDGRYHVVRFTRDGSNSTIQVDRLPVQPKNPTEFYQRKSEWDESGQQLTTFNNQQKIVTGGKKDESGNIVRPFHGTISGLVINGLRILDLASERDDRVAIQGDVELEVKVMRPSHQPKNNDRFELRTFVAPQSTMEWKKGPPLYSSLAIESEVKPVTDDLVIVSTLKTDQRKEEEKSGRGCPVDDCPLLLLTGHHPSFTDSFIRPSFINQRRPTTTPPSPTPNRSPEVTSSPPPRRRIPDHVIHRQSSGEDLLAPCLDDDEDCVDAGSTVDLSGNQPPPYSIRPRSPPPYHVTPTQTPPRRTFHPPSPTPTSPSTPSTSALPPNSHSRSSSSSSSSSSSVEEDRMEDGGISRESDPLRPDEVLVRAAEDDPPPPPVDHVPSGGLAFPGRSLTMNIALIAGIGAGVVVLIIVLAYALYKFNSRSQGSRKMGQLSQLGDYDDLTLGHSILQSSKAEATDGNGGGVMTEAATGNVFNSAKRKKKDVKEWYV